MLALLESTDAERERIIAQARRDADQTYERGVGRGQRAG